MDAVMDCIECINCHWIAMVTTGMYTHLRQICIIGLCFADESASPFVPTWSSVIFTFSVLSLLAEYKPWPRSLKKPPLFLLYIYEMMIAAFVQNLATRAIWIPIVNSIVCLNSESSRFLTWLNLYMGMDRYSVMSQVADYLTKDDAVDHMSLCMSILSFAWMLDATESLDVIIDQWAKVENSFSRRKNHNRKRITFEDPEVTDCFFYESARQSSTASTEDS